MVNTFFQRYAVIMAGGSGERFWPLSRAQYPKQLLTLPGQDRSLLLLAIDRLSTVIPPANTHIATSKALLETIQSAVPNVSVLAEPMKRNTAGCLTWAAAMLLAQGCDPTATTLVVSPADHLITTDEQFESTLNKALQVAESSDSLVVIGIPPTRPESGYGYIQVSEQTSESEDSLSGVYSVKRFHEKPSEELAQTYIAKGGFYWNAGMFVWTLNAFLRELTLCAPEHMKALSSMVEAMKDNDQSAVDQIFSDLPDISIDYVLLERSQRVEMVEALFTWDDVGSWDAMGRLLPSDARGNATLGESVLVHSADCMVYNGTSRSVIALAGVYDLLVVATDDAILICNKDQAQQVRDVVAELKVKNSPAT